MLEQGMDNAEFRDMTSVIKKRDLYVLLPQGLFKRV